MIGKNVLAVYPHSDRSSEVRFMPPMGLEYAMAAVEDLVDDITIVDMRFERKKDLARFIDASTDSVCLSLNWRPGKPVNGVVPEFGLINSIPSTMTTIVGGRWATHHVDELMEACPNVDIVVKGDGEETIREIATSSSPAKIRGIAYRQNGQVHHTPERGFAMLSETLYPNRELRRYKYSVSARGIDFGITMDGLLSSRGCPFKCKFCTYNMDALGNRRGWQPRSPESIVEELKTTDSEIVFFVDNNFCVDMKRVDRFCDLVLKEGIKKTYVCEARVDIARRPEVVEKMIRAGFRVMLFGVETATDKTLKVLDKGFTIQDVRNAFDLFRRLNFIRCAFLIVGNIGETASEMRYMSKFSKEIGVDAISLSYLRADPGSAIEHVARATPGYHIDGGRKRKVYSDQYSVADLHKIRRWITKDFYFSRHMLGSLRTLLGSGFLRPRHFFSIARTLPKAALGTLLPYRLAAKLGLD